jgi:hypothetical protein
MKTVTTWAVRLAYLLLDTLSYPALLAHELCHYIAACLLGVPVCLERDRVLVGKGTAPWKIIIIALTPTAVGIVIVFILARFFLGSTEPSDSGHILRYGVIVSAIVWIFVGWYDFVGVYHLVRYGRWPLTTRD